MRSPAKQLLVDSRRFAQEHRATSWWCLLSTLTLFLALEAVAVGVDILWLRIIASVLAGMVMIRLFILYHDYEHGTILKGSWFARAVMMTYGLVALNPPSIWRRSHDHHHKHNSKMFGASIGSFPMMTVENYQRAGSLERLGYAASRHPLTFVFGYFTVFLYGMCIRSLFANFRMHFDSLVALVLHAGVGVALWWFGGVDALVLGMIIPSALSAAAGSYLFYAQHNFPDMKLKPAGQWDYVSAALESSSFIDMSPLMHWFTGNIGYHHVHHLNHHIPFYRLPEAMRELPELQSPGRTSLGMRDILTCLRLKVWDNDKGRLVGFPDSDTTLPPLRRETV